MKDYKDPVLLSNQYELMESKSFFSATQKACKFIQGMTFLSLSPFQWLWFRVTFSSKKSQRGDDQRIARWVV